MEDRREWVGRLDDREDLKLVRCPTTAVTRLRRVLHHEWLAENGCQVRDTTVDAVLSRSGSTERLLAVAKRAGLVT